MRDPEFRGQQCSGSAGACECAKSAKHPTTMFLKNQIFRHQSVCTFI